MTRKIERMDDCYNDSLPVPEGVVFKAADALCEKWNLHYPDAVRMATVVLAQQPAVHPAITHCDNCGCDWLDNGLNPIGCPYCKQPAAVDGARELLDAKVIDSLIVANEETRAAAKELAACLADAVASGATDIPLTHRAGMALQRYEALAAQPGGAE